jgi:formylglycine-generating enzyme
MRRILFGAMCGLAIVSLAACACGQCESESSEESGDAKVEAPSVNCAPGMVGIPAGTFTMGDAKNKDKAGSVTVKAFCMSKHEVTAQDYHLKCAKNGPCTKPKRFFEGPLEGGPPPLGHPCNLWWSSNEVGAGARQNHPMNCVDWTQATAYCKSQGLRLPTEEEWEYAARGPENWRYPIGDDFLASFCWSGAGDKKRGTCEVGVYGENHLESPFGVSDMAGNLREWTSSKEGEKRVVRGGDYGSWDREHVAAASRSLREPQDEGYHTGFRCVGDPLP